MLKIKIYKAKQPPNYPKTCVLDLAEVIVLH